MNIINYSNKMETITEFQSYENNLKKSNTLSLKSHLSLTNRKSKYKKKFLHLDSISKNNNEICEMSGISRINSINQTGTSLSTSPNKKPRVSFAPKFRLINYVYYDPREAIQKIEETSNEKKDEDNKNKTINININTNHSNIKEANDKVNLQCQCTCILM